MKILAIDFGLIRVGTAIGDSEIKIAFAREILDTNNNIFLKIKEICEKEAIEKIIIGFPKHLMYTQSNQTQKTIKFKDQLERYLNQKLPTKIEIILFDERYSTKEAERKIKQTGEKKVRKKYDSIAAANFLQTFLEQL